MRFLSDNSASVCPEVMAAISAANVGTLAAYDNDEWSKQLDGAFSALFGTDCRVFAVSTGTAANALGLAAMVPPYGAIVCHREAHIEVDEAGAPEFFTGGAKLILCDGEGGKISSDTLAAGLSRIRGGDIHQVLPRALSLTQATEQGRVYTPDEIAVLSAEARRRGMRTYMDGARFANAVARLDCHPADISWRAGVDVMSFGTIKNGGLSAEALIFFDRALADELPIRRKRAGQLASKNRFQAAQLLAMIEGDVWLRNARAANGFAQQVAAIAGARVTQPVEGNQVFLTLSAAEAARLRAAGFNFYDWGAPGSGGARFVAAWDQSQADIDLLASLLT